MSLWMEHWNELTPYHRLIEEAKQERLARQGLEDRKNVFFCCLMTWLGFRLSALGDRLQERYGKEMASAIFVGRPTQ